MELYFPLGIEQYLLGGLFVGAGISLVYILTGLVAGASTIFTSTWSYVISNPASFFRRDGYVASRSWRLTLALGLVLGGAAYTFFLNEGAATMTELSLTRLFLGGILIGIGTRMGGGCTSGHAICGNAQLKPSSMIATAVFLSVAIITALLTKSMF